MHLHQFFVVTLTSLYLVSEEKNKEHFPTVKKIALREGTTSEMAVGMMLRNGNLVAVTPGGIGLYSAHWTEGEKRPTYYEVNDNRHGGHTTPVVALFLDENKARKCLRARKYRHCDPRWKKQTKEVLDAIGDNHLVFVIECREEFHVD
ncbi:MAG: hypothetical protein WCV59_00535 [Parcubacteria group bacterium]|jgi:hypothetical protein